MRACAHPQLIVFDRDRDTVDAVTLAVVEHLGGDIKEVRSASQRQPAARHRMIAMHVTEQVTELNLEQIGTAFGRDRTTVYSGIKKILAELQYDPFLRREIAICVEKAREALKRLQAETATT